MRNQRIEGSEGILFENDIGVLKETENTGG
jgi:hypothetical protein